MNIRMHGATIKTKKKQHSYVQIFSSELCYERIGFSFASQNCEQEIHVANISHPHRTNGKITFLNISLHFYTAEMQTTDSELVPASIP